MKKKIETYWYLADTELPNQCETILCKMDFGPAMVCLFSNGFFFSRHPNQVSENGRMLHENVTSSVVAWSRIPTDIF